MSKIKLSTQKIQQLFFGAPPAFRSGLLFARAVWSEYLAHDDPRTHLRRRGRRIDPHNLQALKSRTAAYGFNSSSRSARHRDRRRGELPGFALSGKIDLTKNKFTRFPIKRSSSSKDCKNR